MRTETLMKKLVIAFAAIIVIGAVIAACIYATRSNAYNKTDQSTGAGAKTAMPEQLAVTVEIAQVERGPVRETIRYVGSVNASESVTILPKVTGMLEAIEVDTGDEVAKGDLIALIDDDEFVQRAEQAKANLKLAEARLERARITLAAAEREFERVKNLADQGLETDQQLDTATVQRDGARSDVHLAQAEIERARAALDEAEINLAHTRIKAPFNGFIDKRRVDPGSLLSASTPICTVVMIDPVEVIINVPENDIHLLHVGRTAIVRAGGMDTEHIGRIERVAPTVDVATRTTTAEVVVPNGAGLLRPGMYADVLIVAGEKSDALIVPEAALVRRDERTEVMRVIDDVAHATHVTLGIVGEGRAEVLDGLEENDVVIVKGQYLVDDGDPVRYPSTEKAGTEAT